MGEYRTTCPRCGGPLRIASKRCKYCGEIYEFDTGNDKEEIPLNALLDSIDIVVGC